MPCHQNGTGVLKGLIATVAAAVATDTVAGAAATVVHNNRNKYEIALQ